MQEYGLLCPKCKSATTVFYSRMKKNGNRHRHRRCLNCGHQFGTVEFVKDKVIKNGKT